MAGSKQQIVFIHGGESFTHYKDYIRRLETKEIRNLPGSETKVLWSKTIAEELGSDYEFFALSMPNSNNAQYIEWKIWFERYFEFIQDGVILLGWSLGAIFLLKYLSEEDIRLKIKSLMLLAPASYPFSDPHTGEDGGDFIYEVSKVSRVLKKVENVTIFHSKDDFVIPYDHSEKLQDIFSSSKVEVVTFEDKNHFLIEEFPELIAKIKTLT